MLRSAATTCCLVIGTAASAAQLGVTVRTSNGAPVSDTVVWLEASARPGTVPVEISQHDQEFEPFVTVISTGSRVTFPNRDKVKHHVYSFSPAKTFEIQLYSGTPVEPIVFDKPGVVVMGCNIHDWMLAYIAVVDSAWFAKSDPAGHGVIAGLSAGRYLLHAWHPYQTAQWPTQEIDLAGPATRADLKLVIDVAVPPRKPRPPPGDVY